MRCFTLLVAVAATIPTVTAAGDLIIPVNQSRFLNADSWAWANGILEEESESDHAEDAGPFDSSVSASSFVGPALGLGVASQSSEILSSSIHAEGTHAANVDVGFEPGPSSHGSASSHCEWTFQLTETADYQLTGFLEEFDSGHTWLVFEGPDGIVLSIEPVPNVTTPVDEAGSLPAGEYNFRVHTAGSIWASQFTPYDYSSGAYEVDLVFGTNTGVEALTAGDPVAAAHPNPFRGSTTIEWSRGIGAVSRVQVVDVTGRLLSTLGPAPDAPFVVWSGRTSAGSRVSSGVYFARIIGAEATETVRITLLR